MRLVKVAILYKRQKTKQNSSNFGNIVQVKEIDTHEQIILAVEQLGTQEILIDPFAVKVYM